MKIYRNTYLSAAPSGPNNRPAMALVLTIMVLVMLTAIVYPLVAQLMMLRHRQQYIIDYQKARYACDSAMKYALATIPGLELKLIDRSDSPDFSDIFTMTRDEYTEFISEWIQLNNDMSDFADPSSDPDSTDPNRMGADYPGDTGLYDQFTEPNSVIVPGPYGPSWPLVAEPIEFEVGTTDAEVAKVTIEIEDENAKMPLIWTMTTDKEVNKVATVALKTFCEWMQMDPIGTEELEDQISEIGAKKEFQFDKSTTEAKTITTKTKTTTKSSSKSSRDRGSRFSYRARRMERRNTKNKPKSTKSELPTDAGDFAKLLHSSLLDLRSLAEPLPDTATGQESALKYLALWGSQKININTAPRHVLEAALTFGLGNEAGPVAHEIIQARQIEPFKTTEELNRAVSANSDEIKKILPYITTKSTFLSIRVTASSGSARASAVSTVVKDGKKVQNLGIISDL